jgi:hypothetical protein
MGVLPPEVSTGDDVTAGAALVRILGRAARADAPGRLRLTVLESGSTPKEVALSAPGRVAECRSISDLPEESYTEWRMELLRMTWAET